MRALGLALLAACKQAAPSPPPSVEQAPVQAPTVVAIGEDLRIEPPALEPDDTGFHDADGRTQLAIERTDEPLAHFQARTHVKEWLDVSAFADGFTATWVQSRLEMHGDELREVGTELAFRTVREIGGKSVACFGVAPDEAAIEDLLDTCATLRAQ